jgi:hypothetical protein
LIRAAVPGVLIDMVTREALPDGWLDGIDGARAVAAPPTEGTARGFAARIALADTANAPRLLERAGSGGGLLEFRVHRPSLHDAFLALTGHALRD